MSLQGAIKRICFYIKDITTNKGEIYFQMKDIRKHMNDNDISFAEQKFREIKQYAIDNTEYYSKFNVDDKFPVVTKQDFVSTDYEPFMAKCEIAEPCFISQTSGSTGTPFSVKQDRIKRNRNLAGLKVFGEMCDYPSHERMVMFRVYKKKRTKLKEYLENIYYINFDKIGDIGSKRFCEVILKLKPTIVFSYPSVIEDIVTYLERNPEIDMKKAGVKTFLASGGGIKHETVDLIKKHFGCPTYRRYADMELGTMGQDTGHYDSYKLNWGSFYFECLKMDKDEPTEDGEVGRIVITDLFNKAMPMIRYDTGDLGVMDRSFPQPKLVKISGRKVDSYYNTNGDRMEMETIGVGMWGVENVLQWQFIQHDKNDYEMKIVPNKGYQPEDTISRIKSVIGEDANLKITIVDEIPVLKSWKRKAVVCEYQKEN